MVFVCDGGLLEVAVTKLDGVRDKEGFGVSIDDLEAAVVVESGSDVEARASAEGLGESCGGFVVDDTGHPMGPSAVAS